MNELYKLIEEKIKASGYPNHIDGCDFYCDISDEVEDKQNGTYLFIIKKTDTLEYKGCMTVSDDEFDLHYVDIHENEETYHIDFDS